MAAVAGDASRLLVMQAALAVLLLGAGAVGAQAQRVSAEISVDTSGGYARIVYRFDGEVESTVRLANGILLISFSVPVELSTERLNPAASGYVSAARRDPDGRGLRIALTQRVTLHSMQANDRLFVDLLPETWKGPPPPLPQDVVEELARRVKEAERRQRQIRLLAAQKQMVETRVRVAYQPNFTRYVFDLPDLVTVVAERNGDKLNLQLDAPLKFDLAEAKASLPPVIEHIDAAMGEQQTTVKFTFLGKVDIRTFREDSSYVVDVAAVAASYKRGAGGEVRGGADVADIPKGPPGKLEAPQTVPARGADPQTKARNGEGEAKKPSPEAAPASPRAALEPGVAPPEMQFDPAREIAAANRAFGSSPVGAAPTVPLRTDAIPSLPWPGTGEPPAAAPSADASDPEPVTKSTPKVGRLTTMPWTLPNAQVEPPPPAAEAVRESASPEQALVAAAQPAEAAPSAPPPVNNEQRDPDKSIKAGLERQGGNVKLVFPFSQATAGAVFRRADTLWIVFDSAAPIDVEALQSDTSRTIGAVTVAHEADHQVVRVRLERPRLTSLSTIENNWVVAIGDTVLDPPQPLTITRNAGGAMRQTATVLFERPHALHRMTDPETGGALSVITGFVPARGLLKEQDFVEFRVPATAHGVAVEPLADDLDVEIASDKIMISRPAGLVLSSVGQAVRRGYRPMVLDAQTWGFDREADFNDRQNTLITAAASAPENKRLPLRFQLARFYLARQMYAEAKGVLGVALAEDHPTSEDSTGLVMRAIANIMMDRVDDGLADLASPLVGNSNDAPLWRALGYAKQAKWADAADNFKKMETAITTLPVEFQRQVMLQVVRAAIETRDFAYAAQQLNEFDTLGVPADLAPRIAVLQGRLAEGLGHNEDALAAYRTAAESGDRASSARGRLHDIALRFRIGDAKRPAAIDELETLTTSWRGDETEIEALQLLAHLYTEEGRYRDAFQVMRIAFATHPNMDLTRRIQDEAAGTFDSLFLAGKGDAMPAIDALALFYDFRELTPMGRRGDEMIRHLADRLVSVDLLDQASELLQHQVDHRLQGAARAQVAARLAVIYLMNRKPDKALAVLRSTRTADAANELRSERLLIEARALSDVGRHDVAIEVLANMNGREAIRMRSDAYWAAKRWREAAEQIELLYGDRWKDFVPLTDLERADILRAAVGYAIDDDTLGLGRFREKYAPKMADGPDRRAFEVATSPLAASGAEFRDVVRQIASVDTLDGFLREVYARYPEVGSFGRPPAPPPGAPLPSAQLRRARIDGGATGSISPAEGNDPPEAVPPP
jgi:tetratricopeptide (TPR) repeat protein